MQFAICVRNREFFFSSRLRFVRWCFFSHHLHNKYSVCSESCECVSCVVGRLFVRSFVVCYFIEISFLAQFSFSLFFFFSVLFFSVKLHQTLCACVHIWNADIFSCFMLIRRDSVCETIYDTTLEKKKREKKEKKKQIVNENPYESNFVCLIEIIGYRSSLVPPRNI